MRPALNTLSFSSVIEDAISGNGGYADFSAATHISQSRSSRFSQQPWRFGHSALLACWHISLLDISATVTKFDTHINLLLQYSLVSPLSNKVRSTLTY